VLFKKIIRSVSEISFRNHKKIDLKNSKFITGSPRFFICRRVEIFNWKSKKWQSWSHINLNPLKYIIFGSQSQARVCETLQPCLSTEYVFFRCVKFIPPSQTNTEKQINNILSLINYNALKKFYWKNSQKMTTLNKKILKFFNSMFKQKPVEFF